MVRDGRPWGNDNPPEVTYSDEPGRGAVTRSSCLQMIAASCSDACDGYAAYKQLLDRRRNSGLAALALLLGALAKTIHEIAKVGPAPTEQETLARIAALYAVEKRMRGRSWNAWQGVKQRVIPSPIDQNSCAHWRNPMDMMPQG